MALAHSKIKVELREISLKKRPKELYAISSKGTVPVLQITKDIIIDESLDIMIWALKQIESDWIKFDLKKQLDIISQNDSTFKYWLDRYKYFDRYPEQTKEYYKKKCGEFLSLLEKELNTNTFILTNHLGIVDIAIFPFIRQCHNVEPLWFNESYPYLERWLKKLIRSELFDSVMNKYELWTPKQDTLVLYF